MGEKEIINYLRSYKYDILIVFFIIIICLCLINIYYNFEDNDNRNIYKNTDITFESINSVFASLIIGSISAIGILFNLKDNEKLRNEYAQERRFESDNIKKKHANLRLLIKHEVLDNLNHAKLYRDDIDVNEISIIYMPPCKNQAWNSIYTELPSIYDEKELNILIKFYYNIDKILDEKNWLEPVQGESQGVIKGALTNRSPLTQFDIDAIKNNKIKILKILDEIIKLEDKLEFL